MARRGSRDARSLKIGKGNMTIAPKLATRLVPTRYSPLAIVRLMLARAILRVAIWIDGLFDR